MLSLSRRHTHHLHTPSCCLCSSIHTFTHFHNRRLTLEMNLIHHLERIHTQQASSPSQLTYYHCDMPAGHCSCCDKFINREVSAYTPTHASEFVKALFTILTFLVDAHRHSVWLSFLCFKLLKENNKLEFVVRTHAHRHTQNNSYFNYILLRKGCSWCINTAPMGSR